MDDGRPPPRCGNFFAAIHDGSSQSDADNQLDERYSFSVTLTMRVTVPLDRVGDQQISRNVNRATLANRLGFYAKTDQLRALLHMNWTIMASANVSLTNWLTGIVYGFCEPARFTGMEFPKLVGGEWFAAEPDVEAIGIKATLMFGRCRRFQPVTAASGPFV